MISIIIPIYNTASYLPQCLDSLLSQTYSDWEALLVDDASTDGSADIAERYAAQDSRFRLIRQSVNQGQSAARNLGLEQTRGSFIAFLDSDDWWDADYLESLIENIGNKDYIQSGFRRVSEAGVIAQKSPRCRWQFTSACARLYRRDSIAGHRFLEGIYYEDVLWSTEIWKRNLRVAMTDYIGYNYRQHPNATTSVRHTQDQQRVFHHLCGWHPAVLYTKIRLSLYFWLSRDKHIVR